LARNEPLIASLQLRKRFGRCERCLTFTRRDRAFIGACVTRRDRGQHTN
jgi:hypothetical protein